MAWGNLNSLTMNICKLFAFKGQNSLIKDCLKIPIDWMLLQTCVSEPVPDDFLFNVFKIKCLK